MVAILSRAWGTYTASRILLALRGDLPWRPVAFFDDAQRRGVLRQSGGVYQFRHARLQDHLSDAHPPRGRAGAQPVTDGHAGHAARLLKARRLP
jgi:hypothetical protein